MLDTILILLLVIGVPLHALWRSLTKSQREPATRTKRYVRTIWQAGGLLVILIVDWTSSSRQFALLGFEAPLSLVGLIGLLIAGAILVALVLGTLATKPAKGAAPSSAAQDLMPQTRSELRLFVLFAVVVGIAWETLYRGYLLWALTPRFGVIAAIGIAATAYGLAHGYASPRALVGSLAAAFLFTVAYVLTHSLWWLIVLHVGLPLVGVLAFRSMAQRTTPPAV
jgi:membrane protease YdiL (CAAX protease family)